MKINLNDYFKLGIIYFFLSGFLIYITIGLENLNPKNFDWLLSDDRFGELIGWLNFKNSNWQFPLGNYSQGDYGNNSVVFNGTVPLIAIISKIFFKNIQNFQYFGFWIFVCFFLQGFISNLLIFKLTKDKIYSFISSIFFLISPIFLHRIGLHISLAGQWIIIFYFLNFLCKNKNYHLNNIIILVISSGIHFYFTIILLITDFIIYFYNYFLKNKKIFFIKNIIIKFFTILIFMFLLGYFVFSPINAIGGGYGIFKMNLLAIIDPGTSTTGQKYLWSRFLPDLPNNYGEHEGFNYFGVGFLIIFIFSIIYFIKDFNFYRDGNLKIYLTLIFIFFILSISNKIGYLDKNLFSIHLHEMILAPLSLMRASGRLIWIVNYFFLTMSLYFIFKYFPNKSSLILTTVLILHFFDISKGLEHYKKNYFKENNNPSVMSENLEALNQNFKILTSTYLTNPSPEIENLKRLMINSKFETELSLSARYDRKKFANLRYKNYKLLYDGDLDNKLFIISGKSHLNFLKNLYNESKNIEFSKLNDNWLIYDLDNKDIKKRKFQIDQEISSKKIFLKKNYSINFFKTFDKVDFLGLGWTSYKRSKEPWTDGKKSSLIFDISHIHDFGEDYILNILFENKFLSNEEYINLSITSNNNKDKQVYNFKYSDKKQKEIKINFKNNPIFKNNLILYLDIDGLIKTDFDNRVGINQDKIGLKIKNISLEKKIK